MTEATGELACWRLRLLEFGCYVLHRADMKHQVVDALPRLKTGGGDTKTMEDEIP